VRRGKSLDGELAGLRWEDIREDSIIIDDRYRRGDWGAPKPQSSNAKICLSTSRVIRLEGDTQPELQLSRGAERVNPGTHANTIYVAPGGRGSVDLTGSSGQESI
jgi:hypothetical protein